MKKAVISTGGNQYIVQEGDLLTVNLIKSDKKTVEFEPLLVVDGEKTSVGKPKLTNLKVTAEVVEPDLKADKVTSIRFKAKKRVKKVRGHRQRTTQIKIKKIA